MNLEKGQRQGFCLLARGLTTGMAILGFFVGSQHLQAQSAGSGSGFTLGDAANYAVLFEAGGNNNKLNFGGNATITGNVGIGDAGTGAQFDESGPAQLNGNVVFAGPTNGNSWKITGTLNGTYKFQETNSQVQTDLNNLNTMSSVLSNDVGVSEPISIANGATLTLQASSGHLNADGNEVFTVPSLSFVNGATLVVTGSVTDHVVFNYTGNQNPQVDGAILLTGGLTPNQVLFNFPGGAHLAGAVTLMNNNNKGVQQATFLDPNGVMSANDVDLIGHYFGGDSQNLQLMSGPTISEAKSVPEPSTFALVGVSVLLGLGFWSRHRKTT